MKHSFQPSYIADLNIEQFFFYECGLVNITHCDCADVTVTGIQTYNDDPELYYFEKCTRKLGQIFLNDDTIVNFSPYSSIQY